MFEFYQCNLGFLNIIRNLANLMGKSDHSFYEFEFCVIHSKLDYVMEVPVREIRLRVLAGTEVNLADIVGFEW